MPNLPIVSIIGRPNVGKSSLFNRILKRRAAVVHNKEGVTRDRHYQDARWNDTAFTLVDTGGFLLDDEVDVMATSVRDQITAAIADSDVLIFMVDGRVGVAELDLHFSRLIKKINKPVILVANKNEKDDDRLNTWEFAQLGLGDAMDISAATGFGISKLLDRLVSSLPEGGPKKLLPDYARRIAILGRPNAGKSTLLNRLLGENRLVTSEIPGTTRDSIDCRLKIDGKNYVITDTAGLRKKAKVHDSVEYYSNMRSLESIRRADVCVVMCDANQGIEIQDLRIIEQIRANDRGLVIALNKWDVLEEKDHRSFDIMRKQLVEKDPFLAYVPVVPLSALQGQRVHKLIQTVDNVYDNCHRVLGRDRLMEVFQTAVFQNPHPARQTKHIRLERICQIMVNPPVVMVESNQPNLVDESWKRYLLKIIHENFDLDGANLKLNFDRSLKLRTDEELAEYGGMD